MRKTLFTLAVLMLVGAGIVQAEMKPLKAKTFIAQYDPAVWTVENVDPHLDVVKDAYAFFSGMSEYMAISFYASDFKAEAFLKDEIANKEQRALAGATILGEIEASQIWGETVYFTTFTKPLGSTTYYGTIICGNVNGGLIQVIDMTTDLNELKFLDILESMIFRTPWGNDTNVQPLPPAPQVEEIEIVEPIEEAAVEETPESSSDDVFVVVEQMPEYPGGNQNMFAFISENMHYPEVARANGIHGRCVVQFVVEKDGSLSSFEVVRSAGDASLDKEALRVLKSMPKWKPGAQRGKRVRVRYTVPVTFKL